MIQKIGSGAYGDVYEAWQIDLARKVALKILREEANDAESLERFQREAMLLSGIRHKNIVNFYAFGTWQNCPYIAVEYLCGQNLADYCAEQACTTSQFLSIFEQICEGLSCAHSNGVIHRDLKPENIFLIPQHDQEKLVAPIAKILDFGLARWETPERNEQRLTAPGSALGTICYMSPEQCMGQIADARSDIYALGCIFYNCMTGSLPFDAQSDVEVMMMHVEQKPPNIPNSPNYSEKQQHFVAELNLIISKCLSKQPEQRFQTAAEVQDALKLLTSCATDNERLPAITTTTALSTTGHILQTSLANRGKQRNPFALAFAFAIGASVSAICLGCLILSMNPASILPIVDSLPDEFLRNAALSNIYEAIKCKPDGFEKEGQLIQLYRDLLIQKHANNRILLLKVANDVIGCYVRDNNMVDARRIFKVIELDSDKAPPEELQLLLQAAKSVALTSARVDMASKLTHWYLDRNDYSTAVKCWGVYLEAIESNRKEVTDPQVTDWWHVGSWLCKVCLDTPNETACMNVVQRAVRFFADNGGLENSHVVLVACPSLSIAESNVSTNFKKYGLGPLSIDIERLIDASHSRGAQSQMMFSHIISLFYLKKKNDEAFNALNKMQDLIWKDSAGEDEYAQLLRRAQWWGGKYATKNGYKVGKYAAIMRKECSQPGYRGVSAQCAAAYLELEWTSQKAALKQLRQAQSQLNSIDDGSKTYEKERVVIDLALAHLLTLSEPQAAVELLERLGQSSLRVPQQVFRESLLGEAMLRCKRPDEAASVLIKAAELSSRIGARYPESYMKSCEDAASKTTNPQYSRRLHDIAIKIRADNQFESYDWEKLGNAFLW